MLAAFGISDISWTRHTILMQAPALEDFLPGRIYPASYFQIAWSFWDLTWPNSLRNLAQCPSGVMPKRVSNYLRPW